MFLLNTLAVIAFVYWISALVSELVFTSNEENKLTPGVRVGFGFLFLLTYFSAAWMFFSIKQAWFLGIILLLGYSLHKLKEFFTFKKIIQFLNHYSKTFLLAILGSLIFFFPLFLANQFGPFSEGGGDVSIYSDTAKYAYDHELTALSLEKKNLLQNIKEVFLPSTDEQRFKKLDNTLNNPPIAEFATYRVMILHSMSLFLYTPYVAFSFLGKDTNFPVYYGIQSFFYFLLLCGIGCYFRNFSRLYGYFSILLLLASHSIISVYYNLYAMQGMSLAIAALILAAIPFVRPFSVAGIRIFGSSIIMVWLSYIHYCAVILPLLLAMILFRNYPRNQRIIPDKKPFSFVRKACITLYGFLLVSVAWMATSPSLKFLKNLLIVLLDKSKRENEYLGGDAIQIFSFKWFSFIFGFLSQQHFYPFVTENSQLTLITFIGIIFAILSCLLGLWIIFRIKFSTINLSGYKNMYWVTYLTLFIIVVLQIYLAQSSLYMQAKGAQNVLLYLYVIMLLPFAMGNLAIKEGLAIRFSTYILGLLLIGLMCTLFFGRIFFVEKLAAGMDRSSIMNNSYFVEAKKIRQLDNQAFVLFEPTKSTDVYFSAQPFFGLRMIPTQHLVLRKVIYHPSSYKLWTDEELLQSDLISPNDYEHLWTLNAKCVNQSNMFNTKFCKWHAEKIINSKKPKLMLFGKGYEKDFVERELFKGSQALTKVSYVRDGSALMFIPSQSQIEVLMQPRDLVNYNDMVLEVERRFAQGEFGKNVIVEKDGQNLKLIYDFSGIKAPVFQIIARYTGEYWLSIKVNNQLFT